MGPYLKGPRKLLLVRLTVLYKSYYATVDRYDVIRISLSSAHRGEKIGINYLEYVRQELIIPIAEESRAEQSAVAGGLAERLLPARLALVPPPLPPVPSAPAPSPTNCAWLKCM